MKISINHGKAVALSALTSSYGFCVVWFCVAVIEVRRLLLVLDVDSTLIEQEVIELLAEKAGRGHEVKTLTDQAMSGEIDFREALLFRVGLLKGLSSEVFEQVLSEVTVTKGASELISAIHKTGGLVGAISGGFSQILEPLARRVGLDLYAANHLEVVDGVITGNITGEIVDAEKKARTLLEWAKLNGIDVADTVAVGDGANDIQMLKESGFAVAFRAKDALRPYADLIVDGDSLKPIIQALELRSS
jgi:phosphoserine phosphatase